MNINILATSFLAVMFVAGPGCPPWASAQEQSGLNGAQTPADAARIEELIQQLGADQPSARDQAQAELQQLGLLAFESLHEASSHDDIEIRMRVRYLLGRARNQMLHMQSGVGLDLLFTPYWKLSDGERLERAEVALEVEPLRAVPLLCRFSRFETTPLVAKKVSLLIMDQPAPTWQWDLAGLALEGKLILPPVGDTPAQMRIKNAQRRELILNTIGVGDAVSSRWLRLYAESLIDPAKHIPALQRVLAEEQDKLTLLPDQTDKSVIDALRFVVLDALHRSGAEDASRQWRDEIAREVQDQPVKLLALFDWLLDRWRFEDASELYESLPDEIKQDRFLLYRFAEAQKKMGAHEAAEKAAEQAFQFSAEILRDEKKSSEFDRTLQEIINSAGDEIVGRSTVALADELQSRGMLAWSEREYRALIDSPDTAEFASALARVVFAEQLHNEDRNAEAAAVLAPIGEQADERQNPFRRSLQSLSRNPQDTASRWHFFRSLQFREEGDLTQVKAELQAGLAASDTDSDVLIGMYRVADDDEAWKTLTQRAIRQAADKFANLIENYRKRIENEADSSSVLEFQRLMASSENQYSWLIGNTEGDGDKAVKYSRESLDIRPGEAGYLDTLARCYYQVGDVENAALYQRQAVRREPYTGLIVRQLKFFETELANRAGDP